MTGFVTPICCFLIVDVDVHQLDYGVCCMSGLTVMGEEGMQERAQHTSLSTLVFRVRVEDLCQT